MNPRAQAGPGDHRASKESYLAQAIDALVGSQERAGLDRAIERLAAADLSRHARPGKHGKPRENA